MTIQAEFHLYGQIRKRGKWFIAYCPPLDLSTQGKTFEEARGNLIEASQMFLTSCMERGTLDQALKELGFIPLRDKAHEETPLPAGAFSFPVPIPMSLDKQALCRA
jgi:predicted RNase H-like HicB family nuclease